MVKFCNRCGKEIQSFGNRRYCSEECKRGTRICEECEKTFVPTPKSNGRFCSHDCFYENAVPTGSEREDAYGYIITKVPKDTPGSRRNYGTRQRWMLKHRYVMQQYLGRPLESWESVHHKNGIKSDNELENLELWVTSHPDGQRSSDLRQENDKLRSENEELRRRLEALGAVVE